MRIYRLRQQVFMLEQECLYPDIDGLDPSCFHLLGMQVEQLISYLRIVPPGHHFKEPALGRIIVTPENRGGNLALGSVYQVDNIPHIHMKLKAFLS